MSFPAEESGEIQNLRRKISAGEKVISLNGLTSISSKSFVLSKLQSETKKTFVVVTDSNKELENWDCDLDFWTNNPNSENSRIETQSSKLLTLPSFETDIYSGVSPHAETQEKRALTLWNLSRNKTDFLIVSAKALITKTSSPNEIKSLGADLKLDEDFPPDELIEKLIACGYVREEPIRNVGEFSVRGGILDVWSPTSENPVRVEFFGDTIDSIREFDSETQLSVGKLKGISIAPMREFSALSKDFKDWAFFAQERFSDESFARNLKDRTQFAEEGETFSGWEFLISLVKPFEATFFDFVKDAILVIDEPTIIEQTLANFYETVTNRYAEITGHDDIGLEPFELFLDGENLRQKLEIFQRIELRALGKTAAKFDEQFQI